MNTDVQTAASHNKSEIVIYQPDEVTKIEVLLNNDNIWLNRHQLAALFDRDVKTIGKHINNALTEELYGIPTVAKFATVQKEGNRLVNRDVDYYNLDMILSIGYRVKSPKGVMFRIWANSILKDYMLRGYSVNNRMVALEKRIDKQLIDYKKRLDEHENKIDFFIRTSLPPKQGIFYDGQIFDAYAFAADLIRAARKSVILIDNYVDDTVL